MRWVIVSLILEGLAFASPDVAMLTRSRPASLSATVEAEVRRGGQVISLRSDLVARVTPQDVQVLVRVLDGPDAGESVLLTFDKQGAREAQRLVTAGGRQAVDNVPPAWVLARFAQYGLHLEDLVELLAPFLRGTDWELTSEGLSSPPGARGCRNLYRLQDGLPVEAAYCTVAGRRERHASLEFFNAETVGSSLVKSAQFQQGAVSGSLKISYVQLGMEAGQALHLLPPARPPE